jgi:uncharacterized protein (UPF0548 family)
MFSLFKPSPGTIHEFLAEQNDQQFSYEQVGASRATAPAGYVVDHNRLQLGVGRAVFERAKTAIEQWKMFDMTWLELCWPNLPIETGTTVAVAVHHLGFWSLNACRIVYTIDEGGPIEKYGFAYGTLPDHAAKGEERFTVEFHADDDTVWYDIYAFSRPRPLARLAFPYSRVLQKRFAEDSKKAMQRAVESSELGRESRERC